MDPNFVVIFAQCPKKILHKISGCQKGKLRLGVHSSEHWWSTDPHHLFLFIQKKKTID